MNVIGPPHPQPQCMVLRSMHVQVGINVFVPPHPSPTPNDTYTDCIVGFQIYTWFSDMITLLSNNLHITQIITYLDAPGSSAGLDAGSGRYGAGHGAGYGAGHGAGYGAGYGDQGHDCGTWGIQPKGSSWMRITQQTFVIYSYIYGYLWYVFFLIFTYVYYMFQQYSYIHSLFLCISFFLSI